MDGQDNATLYTNSLAQYEFYNTVLNVYETGVSVNGETKINDGMSVITDKEIVCSSPVEAVDTYQKVMEMRELTEDERLGVNKARSILRKIFNKVFKGKKVLLIYALTMLSLGILDISFDNYLQFFLKIALIIFVLGPKRLFEELKNTINEPKRKEELEAYLNEKHFLGYVNMVDSDESYKLYVKVKNS